MTFKPPISQIVTFKPPLFKIVTYKPPLFQIVTFKPPLSQIVTFKPPLSQIVTFKPPMSHTVTFKPPLSQVETFSLKKSFSDRTTESCSGAQILRFQKSRGPILESRDTFNNRTPAGKKVTDSKEIVKNKAQFDPHKPSPQTKDLGIKYLFFVYIIFIVSSHEIVFDGYLNI